MTKRSSRTRSRGWVATLAAASVVGALLAVPSPPAVSAPPAPGQGRLAFADGEDVLVAQDLDAEEFDGALVPVGVPEVVQSGAGRHNGEASSPGNRTEGSYAFVSTRATDGSAEDDPDGEVYYLSTGDAFDEDPPEVLVPVTDDDATQTTPAEWVDRKDCSDGGSRVFVAYASDAAGTFDIYVTTLVQDPDAPPSACERLVVDDTVQVTTDEADDLWPSWSPEGRLVFSSTRSDPLGDLYAIDPFPGEVEPEETLVRLTDHPGEDVMPAVRGWLEISQVCADDPDGQEPSWVAYRTTQFDPRGGLAVLDLDDPGAGPLDLGVSQAGEPAWSEYGLNLAYTSYAHDPDGDVEVGRFVRTCPDADLYVDLALEPVSGEIGDEFQIVVTVGNNGPQDAVTIVDVDLPDQLEVEVLDPRCSDITDCDLGVLSEGDEIDLTHVLTAVDDTGGSPVDMVATVGTTPDGPADPALWNNSATEQVAVLPPVDIEIALYDGDVPDGGEGEPSLEFATSPEETSPSRPPLLVTVVPTPVYPRVGLLSGEPTGGTVTLTIESGAEYALIEGDGCDEAGLVCSTRFEPGADFLPPFELVPLTATPELVYAVVVAEVEADRFEEDLSNNRQAYSFSTSVLELATGPLQLVHGLARSVLVSLSPTPAEPLVPPPTKPAVDDTVALTDIEVVLGEYGVGESHPTFSLGLFGGESGVATQLTATVRVSTADVADVLADDGSDRALLAELGVAERHPAYSPDGTRVAYERQVVCEGSPLACLDGSQIVVADADGADPQVVFTGRSPGDVDTRPAWSPDGSQIAFTRSRGTTPATIWVTNLTDTAAPVTSPERAESFGDIDEFDDEAAWSPDGQQIAFTRGRCDTTGVDTDGDGVGDTARDDCGTPPDPDPAPPPAAPPVAIPPGERPSEGQHDTDIWLVDVTSGDETPLLEVEVAAPPAPLDPVDPAEPCLESADTVCVGGDDRGADWSPDGDLIAYEHTGWIWLATPGGDDEGPVTGPRALTDAPFAAAAEPPYPDDPLPEPPADPDDPAAVFFPEYSRAQDPSWSPNADRLAVAVQPRGMPDNLGVVWLTYVPTDPDDREVRPIAQRAQPELEPDWQPTADLAITLAPDPAAILVGETSDVTATVVNEGPATAIEPTVDVTLPAGLAADTLPPECTAGAPIRCTLPDLDESDTVDVVVTVTGMSEGAATVTATTTSQTVDPDLADNDASTTIDVGPLPPVTVDVSVDIVADPNPTYVALDDAGDPRVDELGELLGDGHELTITTQNDGDDPSTVTLTVDVPAESGPPADPCLTAAGCDLGVILPGDSVVTTIQLEPEQAYTGTATAEVTGSEDDPDLDNNVDSVDLEALVPRIVLIPPLGPPGFVTLAVGQDFPPATEVDLDWERGLEATANRRVADSDGTFSLSVVVLHRDQLGPRGISASTDDLPFDVTTDFLVVPRSQAPPTFEGRG